MIFMPARAFYHILETPKTLRIFIQMVLFDVSFIRVATHLEIREMIEKSGGGGFKYLMKKSGKIMEIYKKKLSKSWKD